MEGRCSLVRGTNGRLVGVTLAVATLKGFTLCNEPPSPSHSHPLVNHPAFANSLRALDACTYVEMSRWGRQQRPRDDDDDDDDDDGDNDGDETVVMVLVLVVVVVVGRAGGYFVVTIPRLFCNLRQYERDRQNYDPPWRDAAARPPIVRLIRGWQGIFTAEAADFPPLDAFLAGPYLAQLLKIILQDTLLFRGWSDWEEF